MTYERWETRKQIVIRTSAGDYRYYPRTDKGRAAADRFIAKLTDQK